MPKLVALLALLTLAALAACVSIPSAGRGPPCELASPDTLMLRGGTNQTMLDCVTQLARPPVRTVVVDSVGGPVKTAIPIAEMLARLDAEVVVRGQCNSSCANYFLSVARKITLEPGSIVTLHGSIDDSFLARNPAAADTHRLQREFASRHGVPYGWLLFRTAADWANKSLGGHVSGAVERFGASSINVRQFLVEEAFLRSCLPNVEVTPFRNTLAQRVYTEARLRRSLQRQGVHPTGTLRCAPATPAG